MATALMVVATPIGNLADLTTRATAALKDADVICCEDTRHTRPLLDRIGATNARLVAVHAHNERERADDIIALLNDDKKVCVVSDAGCPGVSDPGSRLVEAVVNVGLSVCVLPGASALTAALMGAGVDAARFAFLGFLPRKGKERQQLVTHAIDGGLAVVIYEAANRTEALLADLHQWCGPRRVIVARELTKLHETFHRGVLGTALSPALVDKGEVVVVVEAGDTNKSDDSVDVDALIADTSLSPKERAKKLAAATGVSVSDAYARLQAIKEDTSPVRYVKDALTHAARAAHALLNADDAARAARGIDDDTAKDAGADIAGADALLRLLNRTATIAAPVEVKEAATALLQALSTLDALEDALEDAPETSDDAG